MIGWRELLIVLVIVLLIFGTKRLANIGKDLGEGIKGFKKGMRDGQDEPPARLDADKPGPDKPASGQPAADDRREPAPRDDDRRNDG